METAGRNLGVVRLTLERNSVEGGVRTFLRHRLLWDALDVLRLAGLSELSVEALRNTLLSPNDSTLLLSVSMDITNSDSGCTMFLMRANHTAIEIQVLDSWQLWSIRPIVTALIRPVR